MASKQCPQCGLWQEENAERCKCGYQFPPDEITATSPPAAPVSPPRPETRTAWNWYIWLWISPLFTVPTFFILLLATSQGDRSQTNALFNSLLAILGSALWHLILLYPAMKGRTEYIRWHGRQALLLAGARTALVALTTVFPASADNISITATIGFLQLFLLFLLWLAGNLWGQSQAERGDCALMRWTGHGADLPMPVEQKAPSAKSTPSPAQSQVGAGLVDQLNEINTKPEYSRSLYLASGVIGGIIGVISKPLSVGYMMYTGIETQPSQMEAAAFMVWWVIIACILGAVSGAILGIISGRLAYAIKPSTWASMGGAVLGGAVPALAAWMLWLAFQLLARLAN